MNENDIKRINELYHKSKSVGLTDEEKEEQAKLRRAYVDAIKSNVRQNLDRVSIQNPDGTITPARMMKKRGDE